MLNNATVMGRMVRDPDLRTTQAGQSVISFTLAVDRDRANENGDWVTDFIDCVAWRALAEVVGKHVTKGQSIIVSGRLQRRAFTDKAGAKRSVIELIATSVYFAATPAGDTFRAEDLTDSDEDLPF